MESIFFDIDNTGTGQSSNPADGGDTGNSSGSGSGSGNDSDGGN